MDHSAVAKWFKKFLLGYKNLKDQQNQVALKV